MPIVTKGNYADYYKAYGLPVPPHIIDYEQNRCNPQANSVPPDIMTRLTHDREISVIYAHPNVGKTPFAYSIVRALASGVQMEALHKPMGDKRSTLIVSGEMDEHQWGKYQLWNDKMYPESRDAFVEIYRYQQKHDTALGREYLEGLVRHVNEKHQGQKKVSVLVLDSIKTLTAAGDNPSKFNEFFENLNILRQRHGWTIIVIHHTNKSGKSYGTVNIDVKVDNMICLGKDFRSVCENITGTEPWIRPTKESKLDDYYDFVQTKVAQKMLSGSYANSIYFFMGLQKGRMFSTENKLPVLMRMLPEDEHPKWEAVDILADESPYSWRAFEMQRHGTGETMDGDHHEVESLPLNSTKEANPPQEDRKPTYKELLASRDRNLVLEWLCKGYVAGFTTRKKLAEWLGCKRQDIDNLMHNDYYSSIRMEDLKV